jgi:FimV-like protein
MLRLADCVYVAKQYGLAEQYYRGADREGSRDKDYILFQMSMVYMMTGNYTMADKGFTRLYEQFPNSRYNEPALYYRGEMWSKSSSPEQGIAFLSQLVGIYPKGKYAVQALQQRATIYRNQKPAPRNDLAAQDFQAILDQYLLSEPEAAANAIKELQDLAEVQPEVRDRLNGYIARYMQAYPKSDVASASGYEEAEKLFAEGRYLEASVAFDQFIRNFPQSAKADEAHFMLGQSYEKAGKLPEALVAFGKVENNRRPNALRIMAEIQYRRAEYGESVSLWARLKALNPVRRTMLMACQGMMRAHFANKDYKGAMEQADIILRDFPTEASAMGEALLYKGKVAAADAKYADALTAFNSVIQSLPASEVSAEAQYNIGLTYRLQKDYARSNEELKKVQRNFETYRTWVYESVLLLAENFIDSGDRTQARASLQSIIDNADTEEHRERARKRLASLES